MGIARVLEALEANDWTGDGAPDADSDAEEAASGLPRKSRPLAAGDDDDEFDLDDPESLDFGFDKADFEGLKQAIWNLEQERANDAEDADEGAEKAKDGNGGEGSADKQGEKKNGEEGAKDDGEDISGEEVEKLERMMRKLQAVRDMSAGLPLEQRQRMARKAVGEVMKDL